MIDFIRRRRSLFSLFFSGYTFTISRMAAVFVLRMVADPLTVGTINSVQNVVNVTTPLSLGGIHRAMRSIPTLTEQGKAQESATSLTAVLMEGLLVAIVTLIIFLLITSSLHITALFFLLLFAIAYRLQVYFENILQVLCHFKQVSLMRLVRTLEPFVALAGLYWLGIDGYLGVSTAFVSYILFQNWRKLGHAYFITTDIIHRATASLKKPDSYGMWIAAERFVMGLSNIADALLVTVALGPVALSGYYLGVNIRGVLQQVASNIILHRWAHAVHSYENGQKDIFSNTGFLIKYLLLSTGLLSGMFLALCAAFEWILPSYKQHLLECMWVSAVAIPYALTGFLRVSRLLAMRGKQLLLLSLGRLALFALAYALLTLNHVAVTALIVGKLAYATAAIEFSINYLIVTKPSLKAGLVCLGVCASPIVLITLFELVL